MKVRDLSSQLGIPSFSEPCRERSASVQLRSSGSSAAPHPYRLRPATPADAPAVAALIDAAKVELLPAFLSPAQMEASREVMGLDAALLADGTYLIMEDGDQPAACGGWSRRATLFGGDHSPNRDARLLHPATEAARVRAMYTHPGHVRRGLGRAILAACEAVARAEGFRAAELGATLPGEPFYHACGYRVIERLHIETQPGVAVPILHMRKSLEPSGD